MHSTGRIDEKSTRHRACGESSRRRAVRCPGKSPVRAAYALTLTLVAGLALTPAQFRAEIRAVFPEKGPQPTGPYSPGVLAGDYLFVSSQGPRKPGSDVPSRFDDQVDQCLANIRSIVEAAGLTMEHIVYTHVYLDDISNYDAMNRAYAKHFPKTPPARAVVGVAPRVDSKARIWVNAIAVRDLANRTPVRIPGASSNEPLTPGILTRDLLFISAMLGMDLRTGSVPGSASEQVQRALDGVGSVLKAAGLGFEHMVFVNPYLKRNISYGAMNDVYRKHFEFGNTPARATIFVTSLPHGAQIEFAGVAVRELSQRRAVRPKNMRPSPTASPCVFAADLYFCSAKSGFIPGPNGGIWASTVENQVRQTMRNLLDGLEEADLDFSHVVAANLYLDDRRDYDKANSVYKLYFEKPLPARTTVQQLPPVERKARPSGRWPALEQVSLIAVKP